MGELINLNPRTITDADIPAAIARDTEIAAAIAAHDTADWVHVDFLWRHFVPRDRTNQSPDSTYAMPSELASAIASHVAATDPHTQYLLQSEGDARYRQTATVLTDADIPASIARDTEFTAADAAHVAATDPHTQYLLQSEGDARYRQTATVLTDADIPASIARDAEVAAAIANHVAAPDPHPAYLTQAEGNALIGSFAVKTKVLSGIFPPGWGRPISIPHGLDSTKILGLTIVTRPSPGTGRIIQLRVGATGNHFDAANILIQASNETDSLPYSILVFHQE